MNSFMGSGGFEGIFSLIFLVIFGMIVFKFIKGIGQWNINNNSPCLIVLASISAKRANVTQQQQHNAGDVTGAQGTYITSSTTYYVTFEMESGDVMEFHVSSSEYKALTEGAEGKLSFQGTRYLGFERL